MVLIQILGAVIFAAIKGGCRMLLRQPLSLSKKGYRCVRTIYNDIVKNG